MPSSEMLCPVALVITDVSEECRASIIRVTRLDSITDSCHTDDGGSTPRGSRWNILRRNVAFRGYHSYLVYRGSVESLWTGYTDWDFSQISSILPGNFQVVPQLRLWSIPFISFPIHYSLISQPSAPSRSIFQP
jgi:hypothetical protein